MYSLNCDLEDTHAEEQTYLHVRPRPERIVATPLWLWETEGGPGFQAKTNR